MHRIQTGQNMDRTRRKNGQDTERTSIAHRQGTDRTWTGQGDTGLGRDK